VGGVTGWFKRKDLYHHFAVGLCIEGTINDSRLSAPKYIFNLIPAD
jgi:hypothetical protein